MTWARLPPLVPVSAEIVHSAPVPRKGGKLDPSRHGEVEANEDVDRDESSKYTGDQPRVTARLVTPTLAAVPCGRDALTGGRGTAAATSLRGAAMIKITGTPVHSSALVESSPYVFEEDKADDSPSPKLGGRVPTS